MSKASPNPVLSWVRRVRLAIQAVPLERIPGMGLQSMLDYTASSAGTDPVMKRRSSRRQQELPWWCWSVVCRCPAVLPKIETAGLATGAEFSGIGNLSGI